VTRSKRRGQGEERRGEERRGEERRQRARVFSNINSRISVRCAFSHLICVYNCSKWMGMFDRGSSRKVSSP